MTLALLGVAVLWKLHQMARAPRNRSLLAVTLCLVCAAAGFSLGLHSVAPKVDVLLGQGAALLLTAVLLLDTGYWLLLFSRPVGDDRANTRGRTRREGALLAVVALVVLLAYVRTPSRLRAVTFVSADPAVPGIVVLVVASHLYLVYALTTTLRRVRPYLRVPERSFSVGLRLTALALVCMALAASLRVLGMVVRTAGVDCPALVGRGATVLLAVGIPLLAIGVSYPGVSARLAAASAWQRRRRAYRQLHALWSLLHAAYPDSALRERPASARWERLRMRAMTRHYYRRAIECRDGLVRVSPYLAMRGVQEGAQPDVIAAHLPAALRAQAGGRPCPARALKVASPDNDSLDADVRELVAVSRALRRESLTPRAAV
ncbi:MAB_1171c family putative transporter [Streptomyces sp. NPDC050546]|uniref:MAB_1171c family putative transporter n=1 Tax=Streptomyces sp. NPDC050546 TaxID=3365628 RepID=UPI003794C408